MTREELEALREGWDFEAKLAAGRDGKGAVPDSFWETYACYGAALLMGIMTA
jgi:ATP-dependent DNA helicase RecG